jgi:tyrosine aminotransferase
MHLCVAVARQALAKRFSPPSFSYTPDEVLLASGCSGALTIAITAVCDRGDSLLVPVPGFPLYETICGHYGIGVQRYRLMVRAAAFMLRLML